MDGQPDDMAADAAAYGEGVDGRVVITVDLLGTTEQRAYRETFVYTADHEAARKDMPVDLKALQAQAEKARSAFAGALAARPELAALRKRIADHRQQLDEAGNRLGRVRLTEQIERLDTRLTAQERALLPELAQGSAQLSAALRKIEAYEETLDARAMAVGRIHRDAFRFAHLRLPAEVNRVDALRRLAPEISGRLTTAGTIRWVIEPESRNIAGWPWRGWKQHYEFELLAGRRVNAVRQTGT